MERIRSYRAQLYAHVRSHWESKSTPWITQLCGKSGMGKTTLARSYLEAFNGEYFSLRNLDAAFAPRIFLSGCKLWKDFFAEIGETKNRPVIFFDDVDDKNDKKDFINALPALAGKAYVVLLVRNLMELPFPFDVIQMTAMTMPMLLAENRALEPLDALRTIAITDGIPELVRLFDFQKSFQVILHGKKNLQICGISNAYLRTLREKLQHLKSLIFLMFLVKMMQPNVLLQDICRLPTAICFLLMGSFWLRVQRNTCCCRILLGISSMR